MLTTTLSQVEGSGVRSRVRLDSRLKHAGMTEFGEKIHLTQQVRGIDPKRSKDAI
jgi:hypothetical protein